MKRVLFSIAVAAAMAGCASKSTVKLEQTQAPAKVENSYERAPAQVPQLKVPTWYIQPPEATAQSIFTAGEATGASLSMTLQKAILDADSKLAFQMKSHVNGMAKSFKTDTGGKYGAENSELLIQKLTRATITGHYQVDSQITQEGRAFRVFVLMRYPLGEANHLLEAELAKQQQSANVVNGRRAMQEMREELNRRRRQDREDFERDTGIEPQSKVAPVEVDPQKPAVSGGVQLLDVDNADYKRKRDETLQKPGAVIGQTTVR